MVDSWRSKIRQRYLYARVCIYGWLIVDVVIPGRTDIRHVKLVGPVCGYGHRDGEKDRRNPNSSALEPFLPYRP